MRTTAHPYGVDPQQFLELTLPDDPAPAPVAVVLHGGFWRARHGIELARPLAADLAARGWAAVAIEYRRVGSGGGWPETLDDVAAALDLLAELPDAGRLELGVLALVGHSAGGHLAAWSAGRHLLPEGAPGAWPRTPVTAVVAQAGVLDLELAAEQGMGDGAVVDFLGGHPGELPDRYATASPTRLAPTGVPVLCVHGAADDTVPAQQSRRYQQVDPAAEVILVPGDHMALIDVEDPGWDAVRMWLDGHRTGGPTRSTLVP